MNKNLNIAANHQPSSGQALITTIVLIFFISLMILVASMKNVLNIFSLYPTRVDFIKSYYAGISCLELTLHKFKLDAGYAGNETVSIDSDTRCDIARADDGVNIYYTIAGSAPSVTRFFKITLLKVLPVVDPKKPQYRLISTTEINSR